MCVSCGHWFGSCQSKSCRWHASYPSRLDLLIDAFALRRELIYLIDTYYLLVSIRWLNQSLGASGYRVPTYWLVAFNVYL